MKMLVVPLVFCSLVCGSMAIGDTKKLGSVGVRTIVFYLFTTALAITVALLIGNLINPGLGLDMSAVQSTAANVGTTESTTLVETLLNIIPDNPIIACSGYGNVAWGVCLKAREFGAKVVSINYIGCDFNKNGINIPDNLVWQPFFLFFCFHLILFNSITWNINIVYLFTKTNTLT